MRLAVLPFEEQETIVFFLDQEIAKTDDLAQAAERTIALVQERRAALISAAATGKSTSAAGASIEAEAA
jgi:type I restriction enzyme S subunit